jgi:hypothetical protein
VQYTRENRPTPRSLSVKVVFVSFMEVTCIVNPSLSMDIDGNIVSHNADL